jgi:hypothetical protein
MLRDVRRTLCLTSFMNQHQLSSFSPSAKANAKGTSWLSGSTPTAIIKTPMYLPVRKVPSTSTKGRQCLNASTDCEKHQNTLCRTCFGMPSTSSTMWSARGYHLRPRLKCFMALRILGTWLYASFQSPHNNSIAYYFACYAFEHFTL